MPATAVGIGVGVLAALAVTTVVAATIVDNWDEITDSYDSFADTIEDDHHIFLPRFRDRLPPHHAAPRRSARQDRGDDYRSARSSSGPGIRLRNRLGRQSSFAPEQTSIDPELGVHGAQVHQDEESSDFQAAIEASLLDMSIDNDSLKNYEVPIETESSTISSPFDEELQESTSVGGSVQDVDEWTETWTVTDASEHSDMSDRDSDWHGAVHGTEMEDGHVGTHAHPSVSTATTGVL